MSDANNEASPRRVWLYAILSLCIIAIIRVKNDFISLQPLLRRAGENTYQAAKLERSDTELSNSDGGKYLIADLRGGLTNQAYEIFISVLIAERINRTLVFPRVRAIIPKGEMYGDETAKEKPFDYIWDSEHFIQCTRKKLDKPDLTFAMDHRHYQIDVDEDHSYEIDRFAPLLLRDPSLPLNDALLERLVNDTASYVSVINPFTNEIPKARSYTHCFVPSERLQDMIAQYKSLLPDEYACLHARTEDDWYSRACCDREGNMTSLNPEEWSCPLYDSGAVSETCYKTPRQIADTLKSDLAANSTLWVSIGSSREALQPLCDSFNVFTKEDNTVNSFMDYGLAQVDKIICSGATRGF